MKGYTDLPVKSEESHYEYAYSHQETDVIGYLNPMALNTEDVKYMTIKDSDISTYDVDVDNAAANTNYLELSVM